MNIIRSISVLAISIIAITGCKKAENAPVPGNNNNTSTGSEFHITFNNYFGEKELQMNNGNYTTAQNEEITVTTFNYWISNIKLVANDGTEYTEPNSYHLVRGDKHATTHFHITDVPAGTYTGIKFIIGVDVAHNTSGAQDGELDPANCGDMFWTWNTGYIQAKLEGTSPQSTAADKAFRYHVGGVQAGFETPQNVTLNFPQEISVGSSAGSVNLKTDVAKWFPTPKTIAEKPSMMMGGDMAKKIAEGYVDMFSIISTGNE